MDASITNDGGRYSPAIRSEPRRTGQEPFFVLREVVEALVDDFLATKRHYCDAFRPDLMRAMMEQAVAGSTAIPYHDVTTLLRFFECRKLTADCNSWTPWMRERCRRAKFRFPEDR